MAFPWTETHLLSYCASELDERFELWAFGNKLHKLIHRYLYLPYNLPPRGGAIFESIDFKFFRRISWVVINFAKFSIDKTHDFGVVIIQSLGVPI